MLFCHREECGVWNIFFFGHRTTQHHILGGYYNTLHTSSYAQAKRRFSCDTVPTSKNELRDTSTWTPEKILHFENVVPDSTIDRFHYYLSRNQLLWSSIIIIFLVFKVLSTLTLFLSSPLSLGERYLVLVGSWSSHISLSCLSHLLHK